MSSENVQEMLELAKRLAREAAATALSGFGKTTVTRKPDDSVVTETDLAIEAHILQAIAAIHPDHAVCAEETPSRGGVDRAKARYCWVIDPIDGTRNYAAGFPCFSTSIAVLDRGQPVVAVVMEHNLGSLYAAGRGGGATLNDAPIHVVEPPPDTDLLVGVPSSKDPLTVSVLRSWIGTKGLICRNLGSTALHLGMVASGMLSAAFCKQCKIWDIAAGALLVTEAGGQMTDPLGRPCVPFNLDLDPTEDLPSLAAPVSTHNRLLRSIQAVAP